MDYDLTMDYDLAFCSILLHFFGGDIQERKRYLVEEGSIEQRKDDLPKVLSFEEDLKRYPNLLDVVKKFYDSEMS